VITNLSLNQTAIFTINANELYSTEMLSVKYGEEYEFFCDPGQYWKDWFICTSPDGYFNPFAWLAGLRTKHTPCFCLCGVYDYDDSTAFAIGSIRIIEVKTTGVVSFFANDAKGFYKNNSGSIKLNVTRLQ
jgi:hypothetical protein